MKLKKNVCFFFGGGRVGGGGWGVRVDGMREVKLL